MNMEKQLQKYYKALDNANGVSEIKPLMQAIETYITSLPYKEQQWAEQDFKYYLTKRIQQSEERITKIDYEINAEKV